MKDYTKEELRDLLVRRAGAIEDINRVNDDTEHDIFVDSYDCIRQIVIKSRSFWDVCEILGLPYRIYKFDDDDKYEYEAKAEIELFGKKYTLLCLFNEEGAEI